MKATIYTALVLLVAAAIAYMVYTAGQKADFKPTGDFAKDDEAVYQLMRKDLMSYLSSKKEVYGGWLDDEVLQAYESGANVEGRPSKAAAFYERAILHYPVKQRWYGQLLNNLKNRY